LDPRIPARLNAAGGRRFGLTVGPAFLLLAAVLFWRGRPSPGIVVASLGAALLVGALLVPRALVPVERVWMRGAHVMSRVTTPIIMGIVYFLVLTPIAAVMRSLGRNPLVHARRGGSTWVSRAGEPRGTMERQF
jgi:hypothetical protein